MRGMRTFDVLVRSVGIDDSLDVLRLKVALRVLAGYLGRGIYEQYFLASIRRFLAAADEDAGLHGRVEEEVCAESDDRLNEIASHEPFAHLRFLVAEEYAWGRRMEHLPVCGPYS